MFSPVEIISDVSGEELHITTSAKKIDQLYTLLMGLYGPQGWWPLLSCNGSNPTKTGSLRGYHPGDYSYPKTRAQQFEIGVGAILTQNTAWTNVEKALVNCSGAGVLSPQKIVACEPAVLKELIKPAGYFNQKAGYLNNFAQLYLSLQGKTPDRKTVLSCKGIGEETADSILLYAFGQPEFVIDTYTRRIFSRYGLCDFDDKYQHIKKMCESHCQKDVVVYQEYHALLVEHAKHYYTKKPYGVGDPLKHMLQ